MKRKAGIRYIAAHNDVAIIVATDPRLYGEQNPDKFVPKISPYLPGSIN